MADTYIVQRATTINAAPQAIYERVSNLRSWSEWSPWDEMDPDMTKTFSGDDGAVGSSYAWQGNRKVGRGMMTISSLDGPKKVTTDLQFIKPFKSQSTTEFTLTPSGDGTTVTWTMTGTNNWMSKIMGIFMNMDKMIGKDFEKGLGKLKSISEA